jgi:zinc transport system ATP-binding protein
MSEPILLLEDLSFSYDHSPILQHVSFKIYPGEFVGIFGPNGGGKTTLLKLMIGFLKPQSGMIRLFGTSPKNVKNKIGYVPQSTRFDKDFPISVLELVLLGRLSSLPWYGSYAKKDIHAALQALEEVGLEEYRNAPFGTLSGGQAQRALIARALASKPSILFLDEPTASVDVKSEANIYSILRNLKGKMTILLVTHDLRAIVDEVENVLCVQNGVKLLRPQEVCEHFAMGLYHTPLIDIPKSEKHF